MAKEVLIVEDDEALRERLRYRLEASGFEVYDTGRVAEAYRLAEEHWAKLDVIVLDMDLEDPEQPGITGAKIGIDLRRTLRTKPSPEFIIYSGIDYKIDYYRLAIELRAAAYLEKQKYFPSDLIRHVKALALSHALSMESSAMTNRINRIAAHSETPAEAIKKFCQHILKPELEDCLHTPFVILFSNATKTLNCAESAGLPEECDSFYPQLQDYVFGRKNMSEPFVFEEEQFMSEAARLKVQIAPQTAELAKRFDLAAFVPLPTFLNFRLSIGILQEKDTEDTSAPEDAKALGTVLMEYLKPTALENMLEILPRLVELNAIRSNTAKFCLFIGQELKTLLPIPNYDDEVSWEADSLRQLRNLADDLKDTGQLLRDLGDKPEGKMEPVSIVKVARTAWGLITLGEEDAEKEFKVEGDCIVVADIRDIEIAVSRLLHWLAQRRADTPSDKEPLVTVKCLEDEAKRPTIIFEDRSERLSEKLRRELFATFSQVVPIPLPSESAAAKSQPAASEPTKERGEGDPEGLYLPLYLAKMLVEGRYHGTLEYHSDDADMRDRSYGNRFVMQFPPNP